MEIFRFYVGFIVICLLLAARGLCYHIGVGIADVTGPSAGVVFMGYANVEQKGQGIHLRQFSRAFIIADGSFRFVFVSVDCGMIGNAVRKDVLKHLHSKFGDLYNVNNVMISATHTHSGPGGHLMDFLFDISTLGFVPETFNALVKGISLSIERAHKRMKKGSILNSQGVLLNANINRSPTAYEENPPEEKANYEYDVDKHMVQLKFVDSNGKGMGMISWFAVHATCMNYTNKLISSDNMGYASVLFEKKMNPKGSLIGKGPFVAAFASSNLGDVSPNINGPRCQLSGKFCNQFTSKCEENEFCVASGPGRNVFESTKIIAERLYGKAMELWRSKSFKLNGHINSVHQFVHMPSESTEYEDPKTHEKLTVHGCLPAMGHSFAAGTTDGPGLFSFKQGETMPENTLWNMLTNTISSPTEKQIKCHGIKPILLTTGEMNYPFEWQPQTVPTQIAKIGSNFVIACVPAEFTTMSGRRLRKSIKRVLSLKEDTDVIIAGLCNAYTDYVTTPEEYQVQRYEGASTIYGPYTLPLYLKQYEKLSKALMDNEKLDRGPEPPDFRDKVITLLPPVMFDTVWSNNFGYCSQQPPPNARIGSTVSVKFLSGHPRNNLRLEGTFLTVEYFDGNWTVIATDADWETRFIWKRLSFLLGTSEVEILWTIDSDVKPGYYRIRHFGSYKFIYDKVENYVGVTKVFKVTK